MIPTRQVAVVMELNSITTASCLVYHAITISDVHDRDVEKISEVEGKHCVVNEVLLQKEVEWEYFCMATGPNLWLATGELTDLGGRREEHSIAM